MQQVQAENISKAKKKDLFDSFANECNMSVTNTNMVNRAQKQRTIREEVAYYLTCLNDVRANSEATVSFNEFWYKNEKKMPLLASLVRKYSFIPASSVASESAFSVAGYVNRKELSNLSSRNLTYSMLLRDFSKIKSLNSN